MVSHADHQIRFSFLKGFPTTRLLQSDVCDQLSHMPKGVMNESEVTGAAVRQCTPDLILAGGLLFALEERDSLQSPQKLLLASPLSHLFAVLTPTTGNHPSAKLMDVLGSHDLLTTASLLSNQSIPI